MRSNVLLLALGFLLGSGSTYLKYLGLFNNAGLMTGFSITATDKAGNSSTLSLPGWNLEIEECTCQ